MVDALGCALGEMGKKFSVESADTASGERSIFFDLKMVDSLMAISPNALQCFVYRGFR